MPQETRTTSEPITRGEAIILLRWLVDTLHKPSPKGGFYTLLHRTPQEVAAMYEVKETAVINAMRRKIAETA
jgi:hypothetical protein